MAVAQQLYEGLDGDQEDGGGLITYMRTDSTQVSKQAQTEARQVIADKYGQRFVPETIPQYTTKARSAQEAHEAIRPTSVRREPDAVRPLPQRCPIQAVPFDLDCDLSRLRCALRNTTLSGWKSTATARSTHFFFG